MSTWGINLDNGNFLNITDFTPGDWAMLREIQSDIKTIENVIDNDKSLLMAFIAFIHIKSTIEDSKRTIDDNLH